MSDLLRLTAVSWNGLPVVSLAFLAFGGLMYVWMSRSTSTMSVRQRVNRPGWVARRRAQRGIRHRRDRVGVGYVSATRSMHLSLSELAGHGLAVGGPKSGKTTLVRLLIEALSERLPVFVLDAKGSPALEATVRQHRGIVWTLDGTVPADLLDQRPPLVAEQLLEDENYIGEAKVYGDSARQRALWAAWALALRHEPMDLARLRALLDRTALLRALEPFRDRDARIVEWIHRLEHAQPVEEAGARDLDRALGNLLDGVAIRGSLGTRPEAIRLEDVLDSRGLVLFQLSESQYPHATRKVGAWLLLGLSRLIHQLPPNPDPNLPRALLIVDELAGLGASARHLRGLVGRAREAGLAVVVTTQGLTDVESVDRALVHQLLQDTAWQIGFRQGGPRDAELMRGLFGQTWVEDRTHYSDGRSSYRHVERWRVDIDIWMNQLEPGDAWLRVAPIDRGWRQERVRVALPRQIETSVNEVRSSVSVTKPSPDRRALTEGVVTDDEGASDGGLGFPPAPPSGQPRLPTVPPECPAELFESVGADILAKCERRWSRKHHELGACLVWTGAKGPDADKGPYGRVYDAAIGKTDYVHLVVWRRCYPNRRIPKGWTVDHLCEVGLCARPDHLDQQAVTHAENTRRRHQRAPTTAGTSKRTRAVQRFAVALFEAIDKPTVQQLAVSIDELRQLLGRFEVLEDKHRGRCWSPTKYADGATTRGNAGVESVSCLVFDCDRVPPHEDKLAGVYWIGHTTWSHTPSTPRWRVVIPLARPVAAAGWPDVWRRARAALCPEADPVCKDPSRAYWLPSHSRGVAPEASNHPGPLLDAASLPALPPEQGTEPRRSPNAPRSREPAANTQRRAEAYMAQVLDNLAGTAPGGRNAALNRAAWTLGRWIAAGALQQGDVEDALYAAAQQNGLVADDGQRQCWATIRSGLSAGLQSQWSSRHGP